jgi:hypothetical protein
MVVHVAGGWHQWRRVQVQQAIRKKGLFFKVVILPL